MKTMMTTLAISALAFALSACSSAQKDTKTASDAPAEIKGDVIDAGTYRDNEDYTDVAVHGGKNAQALPTEHFYAVDREKHAPVGKLLYVLTDDVPAHCIKAKYAMVEGKKKLVVFSNSSVPTNYCIYQKSFSGDAEGFSIFVKHGGVCQPSFTHVSMDDQKRKVASVEPVNNTVSMSYCVDSTLSYGEEVAHH